MAAEVGLVATSTAILWSPPLVILFDGISSLLGSRTFVSLSSSIKIGSTAGVLTLIILTVFMIVVSAQAAVSRTWLPIRTGFRQLVIFLLRPFVLIVYLPLAMNWKFVLRNLVLPWKLLIWASGDLLPVLVICWYANLSNTPIDPLGLMGRIWATALIASVVVGALVRRFAGPALKILLDIFRYISDPHYRV